MDKVMKEYYNKLGTSTAKALKQRRFDAYYVPDAKKALEMALKLIPKEHSVGWGGSMTIDQIGLKEALEKRGNLLIDRDKGKTPSERVEIMKKAMVSDTFVMSSNAISADGQLFNIDGSGNRLAALCYGPESVIVIAGMNKVAPDMDSAIKRARNTAAPANAIRLDRNTPCNITGKCANCTGKDSICAQLVATRICNPDGRIKVILVGEDLGL